MRVDKSNFYARVALEDLSNASQSALSASFSRFPRHPGAELDAVVREGLWERYENLFRNFGWDVVIVKHGVLQRAAFAEPGGRPERIVTLSNEEVDGPEGVLACMVTKAIHEG